MVWPSPIALLLCLLFLQTSADGSDTNSDYFVTPDPNTQPAWKLGDIQNISWITSYPSVDLGFTANDSNVIVWIDLSTTSSWYEWTVNVSNSGSPTNSNNFSLIIEDSTDPKDYFYSNNFLVNGLPSGSAQVLTTVTLKTLFVQPTTKPTSAATVTQVQATTVFLSTTSTPPAIPAAQTSSTSGGLSAGAKAGIGVGVALCALALIAFACLAYIVRRRENTHGYASPNATAPVELPSMAGELYTEKKAFSEAGHTRAKMPIVRREQELQGPEVSYELPGNELGEERGLLGGRSLDGPPQIKQDVYNETPHS